MKQLLFLLFILPTFILTAQLVEITPDDLVGEDFLGSFIELEGNEFIISASRSDVVPGVVGAVYYYTDDGSGWQVNQKILPELPLDEEGIFFGPDISFSEEWMLVSLDESNQKESVAVYRKENGIWSRHSKINGINLDTGFGFSVAVEGSTAVIGSIFDFDNSGVRTGLAYVYEYMEFEDNWEFRQLLIPNELETGDFFGSQIFFEGGLLAVAARNDGDNGFQSGAVYLFEETQTGWVESAKLTPDDATENNFIGYRIDGDDNQLIISGYGTDGEQGAAYIYKNEGGWFQEARLDPGFLQFGDWFGSSVAIEGDRAIVGARNNFGLDGAIFVFEKKNGEWTLDRKIDAPQDLDEARFGTGMDFSNGEIIVSAPWADNLTGQLFTIDLDDSVSVQDQDTNEPLLYLYPNPSYDELVIEFENYKVKEIEILSIMGERVATYEYSGMPLDISQLAAGSYMVRTTQNEANAILGKFIKK